MKKLATVRTIASFTDMKGYDNVYMAHIDGWQAIVRKEDFNTPGEKVIFIEPGAQLPETEEYKFLEKRKYRIKTMKMRGNLSQGLVLKYTGTEPEGTDLTEKMGIIDFTEQDDAKGFNPNSVRKPKGIVGWLMRYSATRWLGKLFLPKKVSGKFPEWIQKTDEERIQNCPKVLNIESADWYGTEKVDGQSGTWAVRKEKGWFGRTKYDEIVCSRNFRLNATGDAGKSQIELNKKLKITEQLKHWLQEHPEEDWIVLQGECIGPKIQGNPYKVKDFELYLFNIITSRLGKLAPGAAKQLTYEMTLSCNFQDYTQYTLKWVPDVFHVSGKLSDKTATCFTDVNQALEYASGFSDINRNTLREGVVVRSYEKGISFKIVSPEYLIKKGE